MTQAHKYLKVWDGYVEHGRDAGYEEEKHYVFKDLRQLAQDKDRLNQKIYKLELINAEDLIDGARKEIAEDKRQDEIRRAEKQIAELQGKIKTLNERQG